LLEYGGVDAPHLDPKFRLVLALRTEEKGTTMKKSRYLLVISFGLVFACGGEDKSSSDTGIGGDTALGGALGSGGDTTNSAGVPTGGLGDDTGIGGATGAGGDTTSLGGATGDGGSTGTDCSTICTTTAEFTAGQFCDPRDNQIYKCVVIGAQIWMGQNLNYGQQMTSVLDEQDDDALIEKYCYDDTTSECDTYGGLYEWAEAMGAGFAYNSTTLSTSGNTQGACPSGWHVPTNSEWSTMLGVADAFDTTDGNEGMTLRSSEDGSWASLDGVGGPGTDDYGFTALAGGGRFVTGQTCKAGTTVTDAYDYCWGGRFRGIFWTANGDTDTANMYHFGDNVLGVARDSETKLHGYSLRCVQD